MSAPTTTPGWYRDGATAGVLRWFDGVAWTDHTAPDVPAAQPAAQPAPGWQQPYGAQPFGVQPYAAQPFPAYGFGAPAPDHGPTSVVHWMVPVGRSWQSVVAGYLGLLSLGIWVLGPVAIGFGAWALVRANHGGHGRGRAVTGVVGGLLGSVGMVVFLVMSGGAA